MGKLFKVTRPNDTEKAETLVWAFFNNLLSKIDEQMT